MRRSNILFIISWLGTLFNKHNLCGKVLPAATHPLLMGVWKNRLSTSLYTPHKDALSHKPPHAAFYIQQRKSHHMLKALQDFKHPWSFLHVILFLQYSGLQLFCHPVPSQGINIYSHIKFCSQPLQGWGESPGRTPGTICTPWPRTDSPLQCRLCSLALLSQ